MTVPILTATTDTLLEDLVTFARLEVDTRDVEPWADLIAALRTSGDYTPAQAAWLLTLYNTYDDVGSAFACLNRWPTVHDWSRAPDRHDAATYNCTQERRNLRGGRVLLRMSSYATLLDGATEEQWWRSCLRYDDPGADFERLTAHLRLVWGVGRLAAFEWAEFIGKALGLPVDAADAQLWDSSGPRKSLQNIWRDPNPDRNTLQHYADVTKDYLAQRGVPLRWVDFETIICDFNVMVHGRYYPGRHLAALTEEIATLPAADRARADRALRSFVPAPWCDIAPGIDPRWMPVYRRTGHIIDNPTPEESEWR